MNKFKKLSRNSYSVKWASPFNTFENDKDIYIKANTLAYVEQFPNIEEREKNTKTLPNEFQVELDFLRKYPAQCYWGRLFNNKEGLLGFCIFEQKNEQHFYIREIAVSPEYWVEGLASYLVFSILEKFPQIKSLFLVTRHINKRALNLYKRCGFKEITITKCKELERFSSTEFQGLEWNADLTHRQLT